MCQRISQPPASKSSAGHNRPVATDWYGVGYRSPAPGQFAGSVGPRRPRPAVRERPVSRRMRCVFGNRNPVAVPCTTIGHARFLTAFLAVTGQTWPVLLRLRLNRSTCWTSRSRACSRCSTSSFGRARVGRTGVLPGRPSLCWFGDGGDIARMFARVRQHRAPDSLREYQYCTATSDCDRRPRVEAWAGWRGPLGDRPVDQVGCRCSQHTGAPAD